ncbi:MFS transporter [Rathayibacter iranicus]|uniref:MFS transporter n=2 Tax=Rathayibacter iranicus TaxID=59737 RepID=A0AAD1AHT4_9MICO|nr:MFS transporter [Rathayibacter iranicus]AZZ56621.1 MFS transporter [Rathayibacter iranicus]MWV32426.1 MFS transporter [Rathayibacter iranicus NCPPB 2253 = VKM Ac-1602]PPI43386.1 MFS transporter [Rathayibacter iranicus]PPI58478.1 MFS transporter [Rathayibacter iranicus]PPI69489.1 MFS transporter [Rathayibacter iranicus]
MTSTSALTRPQLIAWRNAVFTIFVLSGIAIATWVSRTPAIRDELQLTTSHVGLLILSMSIGAVVGLGLSTPIMGAVGPRRGMVLGLTVSAAGLAVLGVGADMVGILPVAFAGMAMLGFGNGAVDVMMNVEGAANEAAFGKTLLPLFHAFFSLGTVAGALLGAGASALHVSVAAHLGAVAVIMVVTALVAIRFVPIRKELDTADAVTPPVRQRIAASLGVWRDGRLVLIGVIMLGMAFAEGSANDWLTLAMVDGHGADMTTAAVVFGVFVAAMTVGRVIGGPVLDRFGRVPVLRASALLAIVGILLFILGPIDALVIVGALAWGLGCSLGFPVGMSAAAEGPHSAARVSAVAMLGYVAFLVGPPSIGFLGQHFGLLNALFLVLALVIVAGLASPAARRR